MASKNLIVILNYIDVCVKATQDEDIFKSFKRRPDYTLVLEHVGYEFGLDYLAEIEKCSPYLLDYIPYFITNDTVGNPTKYWYKDLNENISPTTLRYIKVFGDLMNLFGGLDNMDIVEIGGGYGGQCKIIHDIAKPHSYTIIDLPEVLLLAEKYLNKFNILDVQYVSISELRKGKYDLCISNYAFTEIERKYQDIYVKNVIKGSDRGYITCNFLGQHRRGFAKRFNKQEIFALKPYAQFLQEIPLTGLNNIIYTWNLPVK
jgi:hypothetical protein